MISPKRLGKRITKARLRLNVTEESLTTHLGISKARLRALEQGTQRPDNAELLEFAKWLKIPLHELLHERPLIAASDSAPEARLLLFAAYHQELLSEGELALALGCDRVTARDQYLVYLGHLVSE